MANFEATMAIYQPNEIISKKLTNLTSSPVENLLYRTRSLKPKKSDTADQRIQF
jgi:hypothetical protein